jgi:CRISPR-associated protein Cas1
LLYEDVDVVFLSRRGSYLGRLQSSRPGRSSLVRRQYEVSGDESARLWLAREIVAGKIANQRALLLRYNRREGLPQLAGAARSLKERRRSVPAATSIAQLMGVEGAASKDYFGALAQVVPTWTAFAGRNRRPPRDPVNAMLSYGYAVLLGEVTAAVNLAGMDPSCGMLHGDDERRPSLSLDVMEEFRPLVVDTVVLEMFRKGSCSEDDFVGSDEDGAVLMGPAAKRQLVARLEERLVTEFAHVPSGERTSYRRAIYLQARQVANYLADPESGYEAVSWR